MQTTELEIHLDRESDLACAVDILAEMINAGRVSDEDKPGVRKILECLYRQYNYARENTRRTIGMSA